MFNRRKIKKLEDEILFLRSEIVHLRDRIDLANRYRQGLTTQYVCLVRELNNEIGLHPNRVRNAESLLPFHQRQ
jgi:hypothetical protein